jgi:hypothetical protein
MFTNVMLLSSKHNMLPFCPKARRMSERSVMFRDCSFIIWGKNKEVLIRLIIYVEPRRLDDLWRMDILFLYKGTISGLTQAINKHAHISFFIANISYTWTSTYPHFQFVCIFQVNLEYLVRVVFKQMASCTLTAWLALKLLSAGSWSLNHSEFLG